MAEHSFDSECPACPGEHGRPARCDHYRYSARYLRFIEKHLDVYQAAYLDGHAEAARNQLERLDRERRTLPPRHDCTCAPWSCRYAYVQQHKCEFPQERARCYYCRRAQACVECERIHDERPKGRDIGASIGRTSLVNAPIPSTDMLDVGRAQAAGKVSARAIALWLNGEED